MSDLTRNQYNEEVLRIAADLVEEAMTEKENNREEAHDYIFDEALQQAVDGHQWIIYYSYNLDVIQHSENENYYADNFGGESLENSLREGGLPTLHSHIAFWALYGDVADRISDALDEYEENIDEER